MTSRQLVIDTLSFKNNGRLPFDFPDPYGTDFCWIDMTPSPDARPRQGIDEWGAEWHNIGVCNLGEVKKAPLQDWRDWPQFRLPDIHDPRRWQELPHARAKAGEKFLLGSGISIYERVHFIRGLENTWVDIYEHPVELAGLIDVLVEMNLAAIQKYSQAGVDGYIFADDWGLQNRLMISPQAWRTLWKPRYARIFSAAHDAGLATFLHSCGHIVDILDDLIEIGLDAIHMDQQENMGLELLGQRFGGRLTFFAPVDIQNTMAKGSLADIRQYCHTMADLLGRQLGGFIPRWYSDPQGAGHRPEAITAMCEEFLTINLKRQSH